MTKTYTLAEIAQALDGTLVGDGSLLVDRVAHPADVRGPRDLVLAVDKSLIPLLEKTPACAALLPEGADKGSLQGAVLVGRGRFAMAKLTNLFFEPVHVAPGIHPSAVIEEGAEIGEGVTIGACSYVGAGAKIGKGCVLHPQVYIGPDVVVGDKALIYSGVRIGAHVRIGHRAILHFNASIGADGFSFVTPQLGAVESAKATGAVGATNEALVRIASLGAVEIGDDVEIGANTSIDRGTIVSTRIGNGTKIDNQVQVGHNVVIGNNCMLCGRVGVAGSVTIGNRVVLGGAVGIADHVTLGDDVVAMAMSGIAGNVPARSLIGGIPAMPRPRLMEQYLNIGRIKGLIQKVNDLTKRVSGLEDRSGDGE